MTTPKAAEIIQLFATFDDGLTGTMPEAFAKKLLTEMGDKISDKDWEMMAKDAVKDGQFRYKWYIENILCHADGLGAHEGWLKQK